MIGTPTSRERRAHALRRDTLPTFQNFVVRRTYFVQLNA
jgi:hypothetical protein